MAAFEREIAARDLQLLHEIGGAGEQHAPAVLDERQAEGRRQDGDLPPPGGPNSSRLAPFSSQPSPAHSAITCALETIGTASKSKVSRVLPGGSLASARWRSIAATIALGHLVLGEGGEEAGGGPALLVGAARRTPARSCLIAGQAQFAEQKLEAGGVDRRSLHAAAPR